jgi:uncharacterized protein
MGLESGDWARAPTIAELQSPNSPIPIRHAPFDIGLKPMRHEPERTCIVTRAARPAAELIRFVLGPGGEVYPDLKHKLPGRGVWVTARAEMVDEAVRRRLFSRGFKTEAKAAPTLSATIEAAMRADLRQALSLANKAGVVIAGFAKVESAISEKPLAALIHAAEAAEDGRRKLAAALRKRLGDAISDVPVITVLSNHELGLALGRAHVIHAALVAGAGSDGFLTRWHRYRAFCGIEAEGASPSREAGEPEDIEPAGTRAE